MALKASATAGDVLAELHARLHAHFLDLAAARKRADHSSFALEHGLTQAQLTELNSAIQDTVRTKRRLPTAWWLPVIVYATEVGYQYSGDEYWQTFEARTPGWADLDQHREIRRLFCDFARSFGGVVPQGPWAKHFSIICWPITHAILPVDLQRQFAQLLYDTRGTFTRDILEEPARLGTLLAARCSGYSARLKTFAENSDLMGQVATALLLGDEDPSPSVLPETLKRIVTSLSHEAQAGRWLQGAKRSASQARLHGLRPTAARHPTRVGGPERPPTLLADPKLSLQHLPGGWTAFVELPNYTVLADEVPGLVAELDRARPRVAGARKPLARGQLLFTGQRVRLEEWPPPDEPLLRLDGASERLAPFLAVHSAISRGPRWLFAVRDPGSAIALNAHVVRPGQEYLLVSRTPLVAQPPWLTPVSTQTAGASAYRVAIPAVITAELSRALAQLDLGVMNDTMLKLAGVTLPFWDGEGTAEAIGGEGAIFALSAARPTRCCRVIADQSERLFEWPQGQDHMYLSLTDLPVGVHVVSFSLLPVDRKQSPVNGTLRLVVEARSPRPLTGTPREGLVLLSDPVSPTMEELWEGGCSIEVRGPAGTPATLTLRLRDHGEAVLAHIELPVTLPVDQDVWRTTILPESRRANGIRQRYDEATSCTISVEQHDLGRVTLACWREERALRWALKQVRSVTHARLIDNTDDGLAVGEIFEFEAPDVRLPLHPVSPVSRSDGGLLRAHTHSAEACAILPPSIDNFDSVRRFAATVRTGPRTVDEALRLVGVARAWTLAPVPGNPFGQYYRRRVLRSLTEAIMGLVGGAAWRSLEKRAASGDVLVMDRFQDEVGRSERQRGLTAALARALGGWLQLDPEARAHAFANTWTAQRETFAGRPMDAAFATLLLRLASEPGSLGSWSAAPLQEAMAQLLDRPVACRAARFCVLAVSAGAKAQDIRDDGVATYEGWLWKSRP